MKFRKLFYSLLLAMALTITGVIATATPIAAAGEVIRLDSPSACIGDDVWVEIENINGSGNAYIRFDNGTNQTNQIAINSSRITSGGWNGEITIPTGLTGGSHRVYIYRSGSTSVYTTIEILPQITGLSSSTTTVGSTLTIQGNGFATNSSFDVYFGSTLATYTGSVNSSGELTNFKVTVPNLTRGSRYLYIQDNSSDAKTKNVNITIASALTVSPDSGKSGDTVTLNGTGFAGPVSIYFNGQLIKSAITVSTSGTNAGSFSTTAEIPTISPGEYTFRAEDSSGNASAKFTISQRITINPVTAVVGANITVNGTGFGVNQPVSITIDGIPIGTNPASPYTSATGAFEASFVLPPLTKGEHTISAQAGSGTPSTATITVQGKATIESTIHAPGGEIKMKGDGFTPGTASVTLGGTAIGNVTVDANGSFNATVAIPDNTPFSTLPLVVQGVSAGNLTINPKLTMTPSSGAVGDTVTISGSGFGSQKALSFIVDDLYGLAINQGSVTTDASGNFSATFQILSLPKGQHLIKATDSDGKTGAAYLTINQKISQLSPLTGKAGDQVGIMGTGFAANRQVTVSFNTQMVSTDPAVVTTNEYGVFTAYLTVPNISAGNITVTANDGLNSATATFVLQLTIATNNPATNNEPAWVGMNLNITGSGFKASSPVNVSFNNGSSVATGTANAQGALNLSFAVPSLTSGTHKMKISDGTNAYEMDFVIESDAPAAPVLDKPTNASKPKQPVIFSWNTVTDPSGVTYDFQLAQGNTFDSANMIWDVHDNTEATIAVPSDTKLNKGSYSWRVRAVDRAGNVGEWSTVSTFKIGTIWPSWLIHIWYGLGILIALAFGIWFGRRMAYQSY